MISLLAGLALAGPCDDVDLALALGPALTNPRPGDLGSGHRVCPRTEVGGTVGALAVIDTDNFYGNLAAGLSAQGSYALDPQTELFAGIELVRYDALISAFTDTALGPGHTIFGVSSRIAEGESWGVAAHGRLVLPTAVALYRNAWPVALDAGLSMALVAGPLRPHFGLSAPFSFALSAGPAAPWLGIGAFAGTELRANQAFSLVLDASSTIGYGSGGLDHLSIDPELRVGFGKTVGAAAGAHVPMAGRDRAPLGIDLSVTGRLP